MPTLGIDPSTSCTGIALVQDGVMLDYGVWMPSSKAKKAAGAVRYFEYYRWLYSWIGLRKNKIDNVCVEELGMTRGFKVVRALVQVETISVLVPLQLGLPVTSVKAGVARNKLLGIKITSSKEEAHAALRESYPHLRLPHPEEGGLDVADAFIMAQVG